MPATIRDHLAIRHRAVRAAMAGAELDALLVTSLPNIFYLTRFAGSAGIVVVTADEVALLTDFRYVTEVRRRLDDPAGEEGWPGAALLTVEGSYEETLARWLDARGFPRVGFDAAHVSVSRHAWLTSRLSGTGGAPAPPRGATSGVEHAGVPASDRTGARDGASTELVPTEGLVERLRIRKDAAEIATLRQAARLLSEVARDLLRTLRPGPSERELAAEIDHKLKAAGFTRPAFDTICAAGANAALPHAQPSGRRVQPGDLLLLDFGGVYDGYCVDLTRTTCLGRPDREMRRVYDAVAQAQRAALAAVRPGVAPAEVDLAARRTLTDLGLGEVFGHGTGHGLGIEVHEAPRIAPARSASAGGAAGSVVETLEAGMVFTIEPGAYLPGWGGVRIEDDVLVTPDGCEVLTEVPRELEM